MEAMKYEETGLKKEIIRAVEEMGFESMTPIQEQAIPVLVQGKDIIGQAQTGTGKTAAFGIPVLQNADTQIQETQTIVLCPTRELAIQVAEEIRRFAKYLSGVKVLPIYGGQDITKQIRSLKSGVAIVVGTPGRVMDHMRRHTLKLDHIHTVVLDEADEMLNMGFREDIETILSGIPQEHQTALFSATMPQAIMDITRTFQKPDVVKIEVAKKELTIPLVKQYYYEVRRQNKEEVIARLLDYYNPKRSLIFCNTKRMVDELCEKLQGRGYFTDGLHGDLSQFQRDKVMNAFRNGSTEILIATDVAARGIDVDDVEAVFNYDIPQDIEYYVHRIGRTGRAGKKGRSFTLVVGKEIYKIRDIERVCHTKIKVRSVPTVENVAAAKTDMIMSSVVETIANQDLSAMRRIIESTINDEDITALELAAAFLKLQMGDQPDHLEYDAIAEKEELYNRKRGSGDRKRGSDDRKRGQGDRKRGQDERKRGQDDRKRRPDDRKDKDERGQREKKERKDGYKDGRKDGRKYDLNKEKRSKKIL
ncbi:MAG: DEAD/DEAH box helicase [Clostridia bacterium]|nr:DEAD/DEAH box helicase [Clostridia bacterium]